jgi:RNA polymerase sigma-70 factor (ECF subfamily)
MELRPWLVRVAMNLARDHLRRRKRRGYDGLWLPSPVETADLVDESAGPEARYGTMESVSFAFLVALEALTPSQRAVLVLRDAFDYSSREAADALRLSEENVRITLHRARKAMAAYDASRVPRSIETTERVDAMLRGVLGLIAAQDIPGAVSLFSKRAALLGDGGGVHHAGRNGVVGAEKIVKMYAKLATRAGPDARYFVRSINGVPALVTDDPAPQKPNAPQAVLLIDLDADGRVRTIYSVLAPKKLTAVRFSEA